VRNFRVLAILALTLVGAFSISGCVVHEHRDGVVSVHPM